MLEAVRVCPKCRTEYDAPSTRCSFDGALLLEPAEVEAADTPTFGVPAVAPADLGTLGPYTLLSKLGEGTMAVVYAAEHQKLGRRCAIKRLRQEHLVDREMVQRFLAEARTVASIQHPNLVTIYDVVEEPDEAYLVMELLDGRDLETVLLTGPLSMERALRIATEMAEALLPVHARRVVHRDIKPANVFLCIVGGEEHVKMLDFGAARLHEGREHSVEHRLQRDGMTLGSPLYMSPEQASGEPVDHRSDLYSVGVVLYQMLTGFTPFMGDTLSDVMLQHVHAEPRPPSSTGVPVPREVERVVLRALAKKPEERYQTAGEMGGDLRRAASALGFEIESEVTRTVATRVERRGGVPAWAIGAAAAAVVTVAVVALVVALREPKTVAAPLGGADPAAPVQAAVVARGGATTRSVRVETQPPGAIADPAGDGEGCSTPCTLSLGAGPQIVVVQKPGFADEEVAVSADSDLVRVTLRASTQAGTARARAPEAVEKRAARPGSRSSRSSRSAKGEVPKATDTMNPFAE